MGWLPAGPPGSCRNICRKAEILVSTRLALQIEELAAACCINRGWPRVRPSPPNHGNALVDIQSSTPHTRALDPAGNGEPQRGSRPSPSAKSRLSVWGWIIKLSRHLISLLIVIGSFAVFLALTLGSVPAIAPPVEEARPGVEVAAVEAHDGGIDFNVDGVVIPFEEIEVPAEVAGRIAYRSPNCRIGHTVKKDEVLVKIDPQDYDLEVQRLEEQLAQAQAELQELEVQIEASKRQIELAREDLTIKKREVQRYEKIEDPGVYSQSEIDSARLTELQARDALQTEIDQQLLYETRRKRMASACELASSQLEKARLDLGRTEIRSPIDGVITEEPVVEGSYIQLGSTAVIIQDTSCMEIRCSLRMKEMHWLWQSVAADEGEWGYHFPETPVTVIYDMDSARYRWQGTMQYYDGGKIDERTRLIPCRIRVCEPSKAETDSLSPSTSAPPSLMAGMFVSVCVHSKPKLSLLKLPEAAVQPGGTVWRVVDDRLQEVPVRVAHTTAETVVAYDDGTGLQPGDVVVVSPLAAPTENMAVARMEAK